MTIVGTSHFVNFTKACDYYAQQDIDAESVRAKVDACEIFLCKPLVKPQERLLLIDDGTRYAVETP